MNNIKIIFKEKNEIHFIKIIMKRLFHCFFVPLNNKIY